MVRSSIFAAALGATALLVMGSSAAFANAPAPLPITGVGEAPASTGGTATDTVAPATPAPEIPSGGVVVEPAPALPVVEPVTPAPPTESANTSTGSTGTSSGGEGATLTDPEVATPAVESPAEVGEGIRTEVILADASADGRGAATVASDAGALSELPSGNSHPAAGGQSGVILERLLPRVERRLRGVQTQMDDLHRRLAEGGAPASNTLVRLRRSLELIAPALAALGARVDAGGPLSPDLRQLLHRVNQRLDGAHVSAGALAAALRRSGVRGPELAALLRELEGFGADGLMFPAVSSLAPSQPLYATGGAYTQAPPATGAAPTEPAQRVAAPQREVAVHEAAASTQSPAPDEVVRQVAASGSASAGPGGAFAAAGIAGLAALLALTLPRLLTRVHLMTARSYKAAFLVPLQRPG